MKSSAELQPNGTTQTIESTDDGLIVRTVQDVEPILEANKRAQADGVNLKSGLRHAAQIPAVIYHQWDREFYQMHKRHLLGAPRKLKQKFLKSKLNDPANKFLRTWQGTL